MDSDAEACNAARCLPRRYRPAPTGGQMASVLLRLDSDRPKVVTSHLQTNVVLERPASVTDRGYTSAGTHDWR
ncbi:hypothetical protein ASPFODRAFT_205434 [Aspergillus luchuensis CBS 106.47]|uniref:Uncharacterized protein n=1 Tax=Aspergillus luchuensis (strain CBS 106.47) TaxID=1137211 RepID=A0A1M3TNM0_ASPLC|nr:hypothetical protein ASPFODRAFT_205434 [Aspergillus luchuensis CBS 106.47]